MRWLLQRAYDVEVRGLAHCHAAGERVLIVANHTSYIVVVLLHAFIPGRSSFAVRSRVAQAWWVRLGLLFVDFVAMDSANLLAAALTRCANHAPR